MGTQKYYKIVQNCIGGIQPTVSWWNIRSPKNMHWEEVNHISFGCWQSWWYSNRFDGLVEKPLSFFRRSLNTQPNCPYLTWKVHTLAVQWFKHSTHWPDPVTLKWKIWKLVWQNNEVALQGKIEAGVIRDGAQEYISGIIAIGLQAIFFKEFSV